MLYILRVQLIYSNIKAQCWCHTKFFNCSHILCSLFSLKFLVTSNPSLSVHFSQNAVEFSLCSVWPYPFSNTHLRFSQVHSWLNRWFLSITVIFHYMNLPHTLVQSHSETHLITFKFLFIPFWGWTKVSYIVHVRQTTNSWTVSWPYLQTFPIRNKIINICVWNFVWKQQPVKRICICW